jgi:hypothetical protein
LHALHGSPLHQPINAPNRVELLALVNFIRCIHYSSCYTWDTLTTSFIKVALRALGRMSIDAPNAVVLIILLRRDRLLRGWLLVFDFDI